MFQFLSTYIPTTKIDKSALKFLHQENHVEAPEELPNKTKLFFAHAAENWDADYYAKVNDDVYVNVGRCKVQILAKTST